MANKDLFPLYLCFNVFQLLKKAAPKKKKRKRFTESNDSSTKVDACVTITIWITFFSPYFFIVFQNLFLCSAFIFGCVLKSAQFTLRVLWLHHVLSLNRNFICFFLSPSLSSLDSGLFCFSVTMSFCSENVLSSFFHISFILERICLCMILLEVVNFLCRNKTSLPFLCLVWIEKGNRFIDKYDFFFYFRFEFIQT